MFIKNGVIFIWTGTNASIPSDWVRVSSLDDKYPKGTADGTNPNTTGGNANHTHTSSSHTHTGNNHTHTITVGNASGSAGTCDTGTDGGHGTHNHASLTSGALNNLSVSSVAATYGSCLNDPEYYKVIYITPASSVTHLPAGVVCLTDSATPSGYYACDGSNGTPNLVDKFLKGASAGADAGATGGSKQNTHALQHTHTTSHTHDAVTTGAPQQLVNSQVSAGSADRMTTHSISLPAATPSTADDVSLVTTETNIEPAYTKLMAIKKTAEGSPTYNLIALWLGTLSSIPSGWKLCDGNGGTIDMRSRHLKITTTLGQVGSTGGSNTHTHASQNHSHNIAHTHSTSVNHSNNTGSYGNSGTTIALSAATHAISTDSVNLALNNASTSADSSNNEPEYRTVAFIKLVSFPSPAFFYNLVH